MQATSESADAVKKHWLHASILYDLENDLFYERDDKEIFEVTLFVK